MKAKRPPSQQLIELLTDYKVEVGELALGLRDIILAEEPKSIETLYKSYAVSMAYSFTEKWTQGFCMVVVYPGHVNLAFNMGAFLDDPDGILTGSGKQMRHIKIKTKDDIKSPYLRGFIRAAANLSRDDRKEAAMASKPGSKAGASTKRKR